MRVGRTCQFSDVFGGADRCDGSEMALSNSAPAGQPVPLQMELTVDWPGSANEAELIFEAKAGDQEAFMELCNRSGVVVKRKIFQILRDRADTEDVLQETILSAYKHLNQFRHGSRFRTWLTQIAINTALMVLRKRRVRSEACFELISESGDVIERYEIPDSSLNPEQICLQSQRRLIVRKAVSRLPEQFRTIITAWYEGGDISVAEVAHSLGVTEAAAKSRLCRARAKLRRRLEHQTSLRAL